MLPHQPRKSRTRMKAMRRPRRRESPCIICVAPAATENMAKDRETFRRWPGEKSIRSRLVSCSGSLPGETWRTGCRLGRLCRKPRDGKSSLTSRRSAGRNAESRMLRRNRPTSRMRRCRLRHSPTIGSRSQATSARSRRNDLPPPFQTPSAGNGPKVVARPEGAWPQVLPGFQVEQ
jgi:hypothetical protein